MSTRLRTIVALSLAVPVLAIAACSEGVPGSSSPSVIRTEEVSSRVYQGTTELTLNDVGIILALFQLQAAGITEPTAEQIAERASTVLGTTITPESLDPVPTIENAGGYAAPNGTLNLNDVGIVFATFQLEAAGVELTAAAIAERANTVLGIDTLTEADVLAIAGSEPIPNSTPTPEPTPTPTPTEGVLVQNVTAAAKEVEGTAAVEQETTITVEEGDVTGSPTIEVVIGNLGTVTVTLEAGDTPDEIGIAIDTAIQAAIDDEDFDDEDGNALIAVAEADAVVTITGPEAPTSISVAKPASGVTNDFTVAVTTLGVTEIETIDAVGQETTLTLLGGFEAGDVISASVTSPTLASPVTAEITVTEGATTSVLALLLANEFTAPFGPVATVAASSNVITFTGNEPGDDDELSEFGFTVTSTVTTPEAPAE